MGSERPLPRICVVLGASRTYAAPEAMCLQEKHSMQQRAGLLPSTKPIQNTVTRGSDPTLLDALQNVTTTLSPITCDLVCQSLPSDHSKRSLMGCGASSPRAVGPAGGAPGDAYRDTTGTSSAPPPAGILSPAPAREAGARRAASVRRGSLGPGPLVVGGPASPSGRRASTGSARILRDGGPVETMDRTRWAPRGMRSPRCRPCS